MTSLTVSADVLGLIARIERLIGKVEGLQLARSVPKLRQKNRARSVRGSTGIEGNCCTVEQVEAIMRGEPVALSRKEQIEVRNALDAYAALPDFDPLSIDSLLKAHTILMGNGIMLAPGSFRRAPVEVYITEVETRPMLKWQSVESAIRALFGYLGQSKDAMLIRSIRFHFEFADIHPFMDGNGRVARLWQTRLLMEEHPIFEFLDVESMVFDAREEYYRQIRLTQERGDVEGFALFMLKHIEQSLSRLWEDSYTIPRSYEDRVFIARAAFAEEVFSRKQYLQLFKTISAATASRDLATATQEGLLAREGDKRTAVYRFVSSPRL